MYLLLLHSKSITTNLATGKIYNSSLWSHFFTFSPIFFFCATMRKPFLANKYETPLHIVVVATSHLLAKVNIACLKRIETYCKPCKASPGSTGRIGLTVVVPISRSWSAVLTYYWFRRVGVGVVVLGKEQTLLIVVGCTSAEGNEKSQYREKVFCHMKY